MKRPSLRHRSFFVHEQGFGLLPEHIVKSLLAHPAERAAADGNALLLPLIRIEAGRSAMLSKLPLKDGRE
jgi:hypothetical protein